MAGWEQPDHLSQLPATVASAIVVRVIALLVDAAGPGIAIALVWPRRASPAHVFSALHLQLRPDTGPRDACCSRPDSPLAHAQAPQALQAHTALLKAISTD